MNLPAHDQLTRAMKRCLILPAKPRCLALVFPTAAALFVAGAWLLPPPAMAADPVTLREVDEVIPTYKSGPPEPNPMFYFGRDSQGAEGRVGEVHVGVGECAERFCKRRGSFVAFAAQAARDRA